MSVPSRTEVRAEKRGIADRIVVFSLIYALTVRGFLEKHERPEKLPNGRDFEEIPLNCSSDAHSTIRARWPSPGDLFARIGEPKTLPIAADFLIGWRVGILTDGSYLCPDPQIVAGVQARCSGNLYLSRREPDLSWERLLSAPIAFENQPSALSSHEILFNRNWLGVTLRMHFCSAPTDRSKMRMVC